MSFWHFPFRFVAAIVIGVIYSFAGRHGLFSVAFVVVLLLSLSTWHKASAQNVDLLAQHQLTSELSKAGVRVDERNGTIVSLLFGGRALERAEHLLPRLENSDTLESIRIAFVSGEIPPSTLETISRIRSVRRLSFVATGLTDRGLDMLSTMDGITELIISFAPVYAKDLPSAQYASSLETLVLGNTPVSNATVKQLLRLPNLSSLSLSGVQITDEAFVDVVSPGPIKHLTLVDTSITDDTVLWLDRLDRLESLSIVADSISERGIAHLSQSHPHLRTLGLRGSQIGSASIQAISSLEQLETLSIGGGSPSAESWTYLIKVGTLEELYISDTNLGKEVIDVIAMIPHLSTLSLRDDTLTDEAIGALVRCKYLQSLHLHSERITRQSITLLEEFPALTSLAIRSKAIDDSTIDDLVRLHNLKRLSLIQTSISQTGGQRLRREMSDTIVEGAFYGPGSSR